MKTDPLREKKIFSAENLMNGYLADANQAAERGDKLRAEILYAKSQYWLDRYNKLVGDA